MFSQKDITQFSEKSIDIKTVEQQIHHFKKGFPYINIIKAATVNDGILKLNDTEINTYVNNYNDFIEREKTVKFIPASGAASRMFKKLYEFKEQNNADINDEQYKSIRIFFDSIEKFAFYEDFKPLTNKGIDIKKDFQKVLNYLLEKEGLNYGNLPKALLKFHKYKNTNRRPIDEHLFEAAEYSVSNGIAGIHFTVSPEHQADFKSYIKIVKPFYEKKFNIKYQIEFSEQKSSTDTIAVDIENLPFRENDGSILFRPGGHGALIENLNTIEADIIFVKNIDNVVTERLIEDTLTFKKALAGILIEKRDRIFKYIKLLQNDVNHSLIEEIQKFLEIDFFIKLDAQFNSRTFQDKIDYLIVKLNRPIRVCGMVKNEGEPGGGPFFVQKKSGSVSLQIVEGAQIDMNDSDKVQIVKNATHFNPVDLILAVKNYNGESFDLTKYIDRETGFISIKSKDGKNLKAQELPGLWNGAMAEWNTIFVEVPISTFNPVKEVNDLLRETHQS